VKFSLGGLAEPIYPMRLTTAAIGDVPLKIVLWVITPKETSFAPANIPSTTLKEASGYWAAMLSLEESCRDVSTQMLQSRSLTPQAAATLRREQVPAADHARWE